LLYEPLISREIDQIAPAVLAFQRENGRSELIAALSRFAILAFAPTEHGRHALFAIAAAASLVDDFPESANEILISCARYSASSRLPWSEPPIPDPPPVSDPEAYDAAALHRAVSSGDRLDGERWLAANMDRTGFASLFFNAALEDLSGFGHKLTVSVHAWNLAQAVPAAHRFAVLRIAPWEWTSSRSEELAIQAPSRLTLDEAVHLCVASMEKGGESILDFHWLELLDAAVQASAIAGSSAMLTKVLDALSGRVAGGGPGIVPRSSVLPPPAYDLSCDYAAFLQSFAIGKRLEGLVPSVSAARIAAAAHAALLSEGGTFS